MRSTILAALLLSILCAGVMGEDEFVWIEGEEPTTKTHEVKLNGWGNAEYMSGKAWLNIDGEDREAAPEEGVVVTYDFRAPSAGSYKLWARMGYDNLGVDSLWQVDDAEPMRITSRHTPGIDHMEIMRWNCLAWYRLAEMDLEVGDHTVTVRVPKPRGDGKKRYLFALDAMCFYKGDGWLPFADHKPGEDWKTEQDREAAEAVYRLPEAHGLDRVEVELEGAWQVARFDDADEVEDRLGPVPYPETPELLHWTHISVPGDRDKLRPDLNHCHRYFYRTRLFVPESQAGRSLYVEVPWFSLTATVYVNGQLCGHSRDPWTMWRCDISRAVEPGRENEVWIGIKDTVYGLSPKLMNLNRKEEEQKSNLRGMFKVPIGDLSGNKGVQYRFDMPVCMWTDNGLLWEPSVVSAGPVYTDDAFLRPSVSEGKLALGITLNNPTGSDATVEVENRVEPWKGGETEKAFQPVTVTVPAGGQKTVDLSERWDAPRLWWPDSPFLYNLVTTVERNGRTVDLKKTRFGFREWDWSGKRIKLNGVPWMLMTDHGHYGSEDTPEEGLAKMRENGAVQQRWAILNSTTTWCGLRMYEFMDFADEHGIIVRPGGTFNGMFANYRLSWQENRDGERVDVANTDLFENATSQNVAFAKGLRNHASIFGWSLENEVFYIAGQGRDIKPVQQEITEMSRAVLEADPTRPNMIDGGRAMHTQTMPINCCHYDEVEARHYPDEAYLYELGPKPRRRKPPIDWSKPIYFGESYYTGGKKPEWFAGVGGEICFTGMANCEDARTTFATMLAEGYRWNGRISGWEFGSGDGKHNNSFQPVTAFCRQWNTTFASGAEVDRQMKVFNDTHYEEPITVRWRTLFDGETTDSGERTFRPAPGTAEEFSIALQMPGTPDRTEGQWIVTCHRGGEEVWRQTKDISVINTEHAPVPDVEPGAIAVWDPAGPVAARLRNRGVPFTEVDGLDALPGECRLLIVGPDAVTEEMTKSKRWTGLAASGRRVLVLDQTSSLVGQAVPADLELTERVGRIGFSQDLDHPVFQGLKQKDFFIWSGDHVVYRNVYVKPTGGGRSLLHCDYGLECTGLLEVPVEGGLLLLCQAVVGSKLEGDPVAQRWFDNMVNYALAYELESRPVAAILAADSPEQGLLEECGVAFTAEEDPVRALRSGRYEILVVGANRDALSKLAAEADAVRDFTGDGGWLMLWGVTPEGLEDFNELVGVDHLIRPWRQERTRLRTPRDPLAVGISQRDVNMTQGRKYTRFSNTEIPTDDAFTHVVDYRDIAPFCTYPDPEYFKHFDEDPMNSGHHPLNMVNSMTSRAGWRFIFYIHLFDDAPTNWTTELPRREQIEGVSIIPNRNYWHIDRMELRFDGREGDAVTLDLEPPGETPTAQRFNFTPRTAREIHFDITELDKNESRAVVGIDNLSIYASRSDAFLEKVHPILTAGALVRYPQGLGGILLNQINALDHEINPPNRDKKANILSALLRNMGAAFGESSGSE